MNFFARGSWLAALGCIITLGAGCVPALSGPSPEKAAGAIVMQPGLRLTVRESAFGFGGQFLEAIGQSTTREVRVEDWKEGSARVSWQKSFEKETDASVQARKAFDALAPTPVGQPGPTPPVRETETVSVTGTVATDALADGTVLTLPAMWTEGDLPARKGGTLIWLSKEQYRQLADTRKAKVDLGLFDTDLSGAMAAVQGLQQFLDWANRKPADAASEAPPLDLMNADENWGSYPVVIDGRAETVRTLEAGNAFARISVLANPDDPLVLQVRLTPAAYGPTVLVAPSLTLQKALGYEITEITTAP